MRSRKPSPSRLVTRTTSQSDSTRVPPVTAEKSPPASRSTGADSPVTALSLTDATPSTTSPSAGIVSFASTSTRSPRLQRARLHHLDSRADPCPSSRLACTCRRIERSVAACALPRPSATASAKFANSTVSQSHAAIASTNPASPASVTSPAEALRCRSASSTRCRRRRRTSRDCGSARADRASRTTPRIAPTMIARSRNPPRVDANGRGRCGAHGSTSACM